MVDRRLRVLSPEEAARVRAHSTVVSTRVLLGVKKGGRGEPGWYCRGPRSLGSGVQGLMSVL